MKLLLVWGTWAAQSAYFVDEVIAQSGITVQPSFFPINTTRPPPLTTLPRQAKSAPQPTSPPQPTPSPQRTPPPQPKSSPSPTSSSLVPIPSTSSIAPLSTPITTTATPPPSPSHVPTSPLLLSPPISSPLRQVSSTSTPRTTHGMVPSSSPYLGASTPSPSSSTALPIKASTSNAPTDSPSLPPEAAMIDDSTSQPSSTTSSIINPVTGTLPTEVDSPSSISNSSSSSIEAVLGVVVGICVVVSVVVFLVVRSRRREASNQRMTTDQAVLPPETRGNESGWDFSPQHPVYIDPDTGLVKRGPHVALFSPASSTSTRPSHMEPSLGKIPSSNTTRVGFGEPSSAGAKSAVMTTPKASQGWVAMQPPRRLNGMVPTAPAITTSTSTTSPTEDVIVLDQPRCERIELQQVLSSPASSTQTTFSL
ncbi:hypothetical protein H257_06887 [Aphanomyces astaci]|uniref:Transmembrane protein n=1 Tax=Aphanomyces astaci TaxID=112090 RepID=W4GIY3_APHAT|nr:hypothetical protein H257_06887 [Aphanomyces astaci]ETV79627.1 hypothetical protein H257_06887 [Aphanomyces astaci]|eukprot:XP_009830563.1 hypothetical protein H257_06887 [Aphanomyces astaci]